MVGSYLSAVRDGVSGQADFEVPRSVAKAAEEDDVAKVEAALRAHPQYANAEAGVVRQA